MSYNFSQEEVHYYENQRWQEFQQWIFKPKQNFLRKEVKRTRNERSSNRQIKCRSFGY